MSHRPDPILSLPWAALDWCLAAALVLLTFGVFSQVLSAEFLNYDDTIYVTNNLYVQEGFALDTVLWAFGENRRSGHWHPLTWISLAADVELFGLHPWGFHLVNLGLHALNAVLVFAVFRFATAQRWASLLIAALFAFHPLNVEPVAWISSRKDMLVGFFWLSATLVYLHHLRAPSWRLYLESFGLFVLALLSKPIAVGLPLTFLLWDYWLGRPGKSQRLLWAEKTPFFALAAASSAMTYFAMSTTPALRTLAGLGWQERVANMLALYVHYLEKIVWPSELVAFYPMSLVDAGAFAIGRNLAILLTISAVVLWRTGRDRLLGFGWGWFLVTLAPVNGLVKAGSSAFADRYMYLPSLGLFAIAALIASRLPWRRITAAVCVAVVGLLAALSYRQAGIWHDDYTLWSHTLDHCSPNFFAEYNLGFYYLSHDQADRAAAHLEKSIKLRPRAAVPRHALSKAYKLAGRSDDALEQLRIAADLDVKYREFYEEALRNDP